MPEYINMDVMDGKHVLMQINADIYFRSIVLRLFHWADASFICDCWTTHVFELSNINKASGTNVPREFANAPREYNKQTYRLYAS